MAASLVRQLPDQNQAAAWSDRLLHDQNQAAPDRSDLCLIKIRQPPDQSGSRHGKIRQLPDWSGSCQIEIRQLPDWSKPRPAQIGAPMPKHMKKTKKIYFSWNPVLCYNGIKIIFYVIFAVERCKGGGIWWEQGFHILCSLTVSWPRRNV